MIVATLHSSGGDSSVSLWCASGVLYVSVRWTPQGWDLDEPPESVATYYCIGVPEELGQLSHDLGAHLNRPIADLSGNPFTGNYELGATYARIQLEFVADPEPFYRAAGNGSGFLVVRCRAGKSQLDVALPVDITTLDRFARQLADVVAAEHL